jgi:hypothetical protein
VRLVGGVALQLTLGSLGVMRRRVQLGGRILRHVCGLVCGGEAEEQVFSGRPEEHALRHVHDREWGEVDACTRLSKRASAGRFCVWRAEVCGSEG